MTHAHAPTPADARAVRIAELRAEIIRLRAEIVRLQSEELTPAEMEILVLIAHCLSNRQIAQRLHTTIVAVAHHATTLYAKMGATSRTQAALYAWRHGYVCPQDAWQTVEAAQGLTQATARPRQAGW